MDMDMNLDMDMDMDMDIDMAMEMDMNNCESQWIATVVVTVSGSRVLVGHVVGKAMRQQLQQLQQLQWLQQLQQLQQRYSRATAELQQLQQSYSDPSDHASAQGTTVPATAQLQRSYSALQQLQCSAGALAVTTMATA